MATIGNLPDSPLLWSLHRAAQEFGLHRNTLKKRLLVAGLDYDDNGAYTTSQICAAVFGDAQSARTRLANEQADKIALENAESRKILIPVSDALSIVERYCGAIRSKIMASDMSEAGKKKVLAEIQRLADVDFRDEKADDGDDDA